jgi:hypothetical protein
MTDQTQVNSISALHLLTKLAEQDPGKMGIACGSPLIQPMSNFPAVFKNLNVENALGVTACKVTINDELLFNKTYDGLQKTIHLDITEDDILFTSSFYSFSTIRFDIQGLSKNTFISGTPLMFKKDEQHNTTPTEWHTKLMYGDGYLCTNGIVSNKIEQFWVSQDSPKFIVKRFRGDIPYGWEYKEPKQYRSMTTVFYIHSKYREEMIALLGDTEYTIE